jgi:hypothetical protein
MKTAFNIASKPSFRLSPSAFRLSPFLLLLALLGTGCVRSIQPVLKDDQAMLQPALVGKWQIVDEKGSIEVSPADENKSYKVLYTDKEGKPGKFVVRFGKLDQTLVAEVSPDEPEPDSSGAYKLHLLPLHSWLVIDKLDPRPVVATVSAKWMVRYLKEHPDELKAAQIGDEDVVLNCSTEDLQKFIVKHLKDEGFLDAPTTLKRPDTAATQTGAPGGVK